MKKQLLAVSLFMSFLFGSAISFITGVAPLLMIGIVAVLTFVPKGVAQGCLMTTVGIDYTQLTAPAGELTDLKKLLFLETLVSEKIELFHTVDTKVYNGDKIAGIGDFAEVGQKAGATCDTPNFTNDTARTIENTWVIGEWEVAESMCYKDIMAKVAKFYLKDGNQIGDISGTIATDIYMPLLQIAMQRMIWRLAWFGDTAAALVSGGGKIKNGSEVKLFTTCNGFWKQLNTIIGNNSTLRVPISRNIESSIASMNLNATGILSVAVVAGGTGYTVGDIITVTTGTAGNLATLKVTTAGSGIVSALSVVTMGTGCTTGVGQATTGGTGIGLTITPTLSTGGGTGYAVGEIIAINGGIVPATIRVTTLAGSIVTGFVVVNQGTGYTASGYNFSTSSTGAGSLLSVNITALTTTTYATQMIAPTDAIQIIDAMIYKANIKLRNADDKFIMCTRSLSDAFENQLTVGTIYTQIQWETAENGMQYFKRKGVDIYPIDLWDVFIQTYEDNGTKFNNPHRAVFTTKSNLHIGTPSSDLIETLDIWFNKDLQQTRMLAKDQIGAQLVDATLVMYAV